jgi:glutaredoxin
MIKLTLYSTVGCHLCELAKEILLSVEQAFTFTEVEIGDDDDLVNRYGTRIPVILFPDESELSWPFNAQDIVKKLIIINP